MLQTSAQVQTFLDQPVYETVEASQEALSLPVWAPSHTNGRKRPINTYADFLADLATLRPYGPVATLPYLGRHTACGQQPN